MLTYHRARLAMLDAWASHDVDTFNAFRDRLRQHGKMRHHTRALDVGCGSNAPMTLLMHAAGMHVTGIDWRIGHRWGLGFKPSRYVAYSREAGLSATARKAIGELVYDRRYFNTLRSVSRLPIADTADLREMDVTKLDFTDASFDVIHSNATWEHLADVPAANRQIARVLKPGGLACIEIHLFPSISGGHDLPWIVPGKLELGDVQPWRHLRDPQWKAPVFLNRLAERDYQRAFDQTPGLEIVDWQTEYTEGESLVTEAILRELSAYTREDLTRRSIIVVVRRQ